MNKSDEFYIGWQSQAPFGIRSHVRKTVLALVVLLLALACLLALAQRTIGVAVFEWGTPVVMGRVPALEGGGARAGWIAANGGVGQYLDASV